MHLELQVADEGEKSCEQIWISAKTLEYMALSMLKRQRLFSVNSVLALSPQTMQDVDQQIENVFRVFELQLRHKQLSFQIQTDCQCLGIFLAEWELYELILFHLLSNAVKFSTTGGCIIIILSP